MKGDVGVVHFMIPFPSQKTFFLGVLVLHGCLCMGASHAFLNGHLKKELSCCYEESQDKSSPKKNLWFEEIPPWKMLESMSGSCDMIKHL